MDLPGVVLECVRPAPVDTDTEAVPRIVLTGADWEADETAEPGSTHYTMDFVVTGWVPDASDLGVAQGLSDLRDDTGASVKPGGEFTARFSMLAINPLSSPYIA